VREAQEPQEVLKPLAASAAKECELPAGRIWVNKGGWIWKEVYGPDIGLGRWRGRRGQGVRTSLGTCG
jgi:hypothetical protein